MRSKAGEVEVEVAVTDDLMPGVVSLPHGWGHSIASRPRGGAGHAGRQRQPPDRRRPRRHRGRLSGMARMTAIPVEVEPA
ncbi:MAG: hypothetical protein H6518_09760 [Microthrixaceae bacterium]|nr:hypothetical protein [Microthrixaceae bacterium]